MSETGAIDTFSLKSANGQALPSRAKAASGLNYLHNQLGFMPMPYRTAEYTLSPAP